MAVWATRASVSSILPEVTDGFKDKLKSTVKELEGAAVADDRAVCHALSPLTCSCWCGNNEN